LIKKPRQIPLNILMLHALLRRINLTPEEEKQIKDDQRKYESGYKGEVSIEYWLEFLPEKETYILHDLRLLDEKGLAFQMDTVILTNSFILVIDVKNHSGMLTIDPILHQMKQKYKDYNEAVYDDPVQQAKMHEHQLAEWLASHNFPKIPIVSLVLFSHPSAYITFTTKNFDYEQKVIHPPTLIERFHSYRKSYTQLLYTDKDCRKLSRALIKGYVPHKWDLLSTYDIDTSRIIFGPHCPICKVIPISKHRGTFDCKECDFKGSNSFDIYIQSLYDFALLRGRKITNRECCHFLRISPSTAQRLLNKICLTKTGKYRDCVYLLPYPEEKY
jgi:hypothetical protein